MYICIHAYILYVYIYIYIYTYRLHPARAYLEPRATKFEFTP